MFARKTLEQLRDSGILSVVVGSLCLCVTPGCSDDGSLPATSHCTPTTCSATGADCGLLGDGGGPACTPQCKGVACGQSDGCGGTCPGSNPVGGPATSGIVASGYWCTTVVGAVTAAQAAPAPSYTFPSDPYCLNWRGYTHVFSNALPYKPYAASGGCAKRCDLLIARDGTENTLSNDDSDHGKLVPVTQVGHIFKSSQIRALYQAGEGYASRDLQASLDGYQNYWAYDSRNGVGMDLRNTVLLHAISKERARALAAGCDELLIHAVGFSRGSCALDRLYSAWLPVLRETVSPRVKIGFVTLFDPVCALDTWNATGLMLTEKIELVGRTCLVDGDCISGTCGPNKLCTSNSRQITPLYNDAAPLLETIVHKYGETRYEFGPVELYSNFESYPQPLPFVQQVDDSYYYSDGAPGWSTQTAPPFDGNFTVGAGNGPVDETKRKNAIEIIDLFGTHSAYWRRQGSGAGEINPHAVAEMGLGLWQFCKNHILACDPVPFDVRDYMTRPAPLGDTGGVLAVRPRDLPAQQHWFPYAFQIPHTAAVDYMSDPADRNFAARQVATYDYATFYPYKTEPGKPDLALMSWGTFYGTPIVGSSELVAAETYGAPAGTGYWVLHTDIGNVNLMDRAYAAGTAPYAGFQGDVASDYDRHGLTFDSQAAYDKFCDNFSSVGTIMGCD
jgi:hypothetical protein